MMAEEDQLTEEVGNAFDSCFSVSGSCSFKNLERMTTGVTCICRWPVWSFSHKVLSFDQCAYAGYLYKPIGPIKIWFDYRKGHGQILWRNWDFKTTVKS